MYHPRQPLKNMRNPKKIKSRNPKSKPLGNIEIRAKRRVALEKRLAGGSSPHLLYVFPRSEYPKENPLPKQVVEILPANPAQESHGEIQENQEPKKKICRCISVSLYKTLSFS
jgi:hypothetical protein